VSQLAQPLVAAPSSAEETVTVEAQPAATRAHAVPFTELVSAHFGWWNARGTPGEPAARHRYDLDRRSFERRHGDIVASYWCSHVESAVALTERRRARGWLSPTFGFHRESDWATKESPDVATELHRCDELAVRANTVLTGVRRRICLRLVVAAASHLLSLVDEPAAPADVAVQAVALKHEKAAIAEAKSYYRDAANGQAQMVYFGGMSAVAIAIGIVSTIWLSISWATPVAALMAGALGAVVSVVQRINTGKFTLEYDVGGAYTFFLGGLRPLIGGAFALTISFAFTGGLLHLPVAQGESPGDRHLALLVLGFLAGFSERWAQDTLTSIVPSQAAPPPATSPATPEAAAPADMPADGV
jgi:hypothetical protein